MKKNQVDLLNDMEALENYNKVIFIDEEFQDAYFQRAKLYFKLKKYQLSFGDFERALNIKMSENICYYYAKAKEELGLYEEALEIMNKVSKFTSHKFYFFKAQLYEKLKNYFEALRNYENCIKSESGIDHSAAYKGRIRMINNLKETGKFDYSMVAEFEYWDRTRP